MALPDDKIRVSFVLEKTTLSDLKHAAFVDKISMSKIMSGLAKNYVTLSKKREEAFNLKMKENG